MTLIGPARIQFNSGINLGDFLTSISRTSPAPIKTDAINRIFSAVPSRGHQLILNAVEEDLSQGTLWRYLYDNRNTKDVPLVWTTQDGLRSWAGVAAVIPDPSQGGAANAHGVFTVTIDLVNAPTLVDPGSDPTWSIAIVGTPTGGTFTIAVNGAKTAPLAYNANLAAILAAINALSGVTGVSGVTGSGTGPFALVFPAAVTVGVSHALTGGTSPNVTATP